MTARHLTDEDAATIRVQYWSHHRTQTALAKHYRVSQCAIHKIVYGITYANAGGPLSEQASTLKGQNQTRSILDERYAKF